MKIEKKSFMESVLARAEVFTNKYIELHGNTATNDSVADFLHENFPGNDTNYYIYKVTTDVNATRSLFPWAVKTIGDALNEVKYGCLMFFPQIDKKVWETQLKQLITEDECIVKNGEPEYELEPHITLLYGLVDEELVYPELVQEVNKYIEVNGLNIKLGKISLFENNNGKEDVVKISIEDINGSLAGLNQMLKDKFNYVSEYDNYIPHMTLAYVKVGEGKKYEGINIDPSVWGIESPSNGKIIYSDANRNNNIVREFIEEPFLKAGIKIHKKASCIKQKWAKDSILEKADIYLTDDSIDLSAEHVNVGEVEQAIVDEQVRRILIKKAVDGRQTLHVQYPDQRDHKSFKKADQLRPSDYFEYLMSSVQGMSQQTSEKAIKGEINALLKAHSKNKFSIKNLSQRQIDTLTDLWKGVGARGHGYEETDDYSYMQKAGIDHINHNFSKAQVQGWIGQIKNLNGDQLLDMSINYEKHNSVIVQLVRDELSSREASMQSA